MGFPREAAALGTRRGAAILGVLTTVAGSVAFLLTGNPWLALSLVLGFLALLFFDLAHQFWKQRNTAEERTRAVERDKEAAEATPQFKIDAVLRKTLALSTALKHEDGKSETKRRRAALAVIFEAHNLIATSAPAYLEDLEMEIPEDVELWKAVEECYRVLAKVRKQL